MDYPVTQDDILLCTLPNRIARLKVELMTMQGQTLLEISSETIDGALTIESESDVRRIVDLTLECIDEAYDFGADKRIWFDKKIGLSYGILGLDDEWKYFPLGVFAFTGANFSYDESSSVAKLSAADLMAFTLQERGSQIGANEVVVEVNSNIRNAMIATLKRFTPLLDYAIEEFPSDQQVVPYDVEVDSGAYPHDIVKKLRDLYPNYETFMDIYGTFICRKIPERVDDPLFLDETVLDPLIISEQINTDFGVRNVTEIRGAEIEADRTMPFCYTSDDTYVAALTPHEDPVIVVQPESVTATLDASVSFSVTALGSGLTYCWEYKTPDADWLESTATGAKTSTMSLAASSHRNGYLYRCRVIDAAGIEIISDAAILLIEGIAEPLRIIRQPVDAVVSMGNTIVFTVEATGVASYQWKYSRDAGATWLNINWSGYQTATLVGTLTEARLGYTFRCVLTGEDGSVLSTDVVGIIENPATITIIRQPVNAQATNGELFYFSVSATGVASYQWQYSSNGGKSWYDLSWNGAATPIVSEVGNSVRIGTYVYRCLLTGADGTQLGTNIVQVIDPATYVYVNDESICVTPTTESKEAQKLLIANLSLCPIVIRKYTTKGEQIDEPIAAGVMKAGYPYVLRYMDGVFLYEGELNVHAIVKEVAVMPSADEQERDQIENDCRTIEYVVNPESPFTVEKIGEIRQVLSGGEYEDIYTSQLAIERARWENWKKTRLNDGATVTMLLLPFMEVNKKIRYTSPRTGEKLTYLVKGISMDFGGCTMTLDLIRFYPYYIWQ